jgi:hypothetical protein
MDAPMNRLPSEAAALLNGTDHPVEKLDETDRLILAAATVELEAMKKRQFFLQKELTLISADIYRKAEEIEKKWGAVTEKHKLRKGDQTVNLKTGEIANISKKV